MLEFGTNNAEINESCKLPPFVLSMQDTPDNELVITIALPQIENNNVITERISECDNPRLKEILSAAQPVYEDMERIYEIRFERYILYQCRNESYADSDPSEIVRGKHLVILEKSLLLEYYQKVITDFDYDTEKANRKHYGIYAANHTIDVISNEPPVIIRVYSAPAQQ